MATSKYDNGKWRRMAGRVLILLTGLSLSACSVAHMALPQGLEAESTALEVEGKGSSFITKKMRFGPYEVTGINRGWTRGSGWSAAGFTSAGAKQKYRFSVTGPERGTWNVQCATGANWSKLETEGFLGGTFGIEFSADQQLVCNLKQESGGGESKLFMSRSARAGEDALHGVMLDGNTRIDVAGTHKLGGTPVPLGDPTGYSFHIGGHPVGAVEVINKGTVWLSNAASPDARSALAATAAVMLLYQDLQKQSERN